MPFVALLRRGACLLAVGAAIVVPSTTRTPHPVEAALASGQFSVVPQVAAVGTPVVASGSCSGTLRFSLVGQAAGWTPPAPLLIDAAPAADMFGNWSLTFPMPNVPATATMRCDLHMITTSDTLFLAPPSAALPVRVFDDSASLLKGVQPNVLQAFSLDNTPVTLGGVTTDSNGLIVSLAPGPNPATVVLLGIESLGENAAADQVTRVQAWRLDMPGPDVNVGATADAHAVRLG